MQNISGFGLVINIIADTTFPVGFVVTQLADDTDPLDTPPVRIADLALGLNGDPISWSKAIALPMVLNVIPNSDDDRNLQILADANRVAQNKNSANDVITATIIYPDGTRITMTEGKLCDAPFGLGVSTAGRMKTRSYSFLFASKT